ncbi:hypothetical protein V6N13_009213 [Hibiscus sabdariffa]|uniref:Uncharacterized protein n=2 Tax=Hibiscus sabdariffa TaxID=183260 RepID=A0ABR2DJ56_9ROSI
MQKLATQFTLIFASVIVSTILVVSQAQLRLGFYSETCPNAETIIREVVQKAVANDPRNAAILLRLQFHDCFVQGCDGSILIREDEDGELKAPGNLGVGGLDIIESAKARLEQVCPGIVSCADVVALAARDAVSLVNGPFYHVPTGRRDGRLSKMSLAQKLPDVDDSIDVIKFKFRVKGLSDQDLVLLSAGAHTIGVTACFFMQKRLYNFSGGGGSDPGINPGFLQKLKAKCPVNGDVNVRIPLDWSTQNVFDVEIMRNIRDGTAVIASDARLYDDPETRQIVDSYAASQEATSFHQDFADAMVKMGNIGVKTGSRGEIRRVCSAVN